MAISTSEQYQSQLLALAPRGAAWPRSPQSWFGKLLLGLADTFRRVDDGLDQLLAEADPRSAFLLLSDWEAYAGLPGACAQLAGISLTVEQRRLALAAKLTSRGGQSRAYFIGLAAQLGYTVDITEFKEWSFDSDDDTPLYGVDWNFAWQVNAPLNTTVDWTFDSDDDTPFAAWGNQLLECGLNQFKPAHTDLIFAYL